MRPVTGLLAVSGVALLLLGPSRQDRVPWIVWNASASVPIGLYVVRPAGHPAVGDLVAMRPSQRVAEWLHSRGFLDHGSLLLKRIAAVHGALICRHEATVLIDGMPAAVAASGDRSGRELPGWHGCRRLGKGDVFLLNPNEPRSLDSRYFGPFDAETIVGRLLPLWTRGG